MIRIITDSTCDLRPAQREALEHQGPEAPKKKAPDRGER